MIYKYTKCESVIAKIMADADMSEKKIRISDIREWIFEAIEKIGAPVQYEEKESGIDGPILPIEGYQVPIPDDLEALNAVAYSVTPEGPWVPVRKDSSTFKFIKPGKRKIVEHVSIGPTHSTENPFLDDIPATGEYDVAYLNKKEHLPQQQMIYKQPVTKAQLYTEMARPADKEKIMAALRNTEVTYFIKPGWVVLNKEKGFVKLHYKAIATDERGYPLIPDTASYQEAVYWYVMMKLNFPKFLTGSLGGKSRYNLATYQYIQTQWNFYRNQAYAEAMMPNEGEMRSIKNAWHKLIPEWDADDRFFKTSGERELSYNDYYYGY